MRSVEDAAIGKALLLQREVEPGERREGEERGDPSIAATDEGKRARGENGGEPHVDEGQGDDTEENVIVGFNSFGDFALGIALIYYITKGADIMGVQTAVNLAGACESS